MTDEQIRKLDKCRDSLKSLHTKTGHVQEVLKELSGGILDNELGKEINDIFKNLRASVNESLRRASKEIDDLIKEI